MFYMSIPHMGCFFFVISLGARFGSWPCAEVLTVYGGISAYERPGGWPLPISHLKIDLNSPNAYFLI